MKTGKFNCTIAWHGMPAYAQVLLYSLKKTGFKFNILTTNYNYCQLRYKELFSEIIIIEENKKYKWQDLNLNIPRVFFKTGWAYHSFNSLAEEVSSNGGKVISLVDNIRKYNFRQFIGRIIYRFFIKNKSNMIWVPGNSSALLMRYFGESESKIIQGLYCADTNIYKYEIPIEKRSNKIVFIGQLIDRKSILNLVSGFRALKNELHNWELKIIGDGYLRNQVNENLDHNITLLEYSDPEFIAKILNTSKVLILPSVEEHWGVVIHEAVRCGCLVITTEHTGAVMDLLNHRNSILLKDSSINEIKNGFRQMLKLSNADWEGVILENQIQGSKFTIEKWIINFKNIYNVNII
jgi:glycosyltransferase involved in cell wall biosynthesis